MLTNDLHFLLHVMYENFEKYFKTGDMIFTGSIVYDKVGLYKKDVFKDVDISIISGENGDKIINEIKDFFTTNQFVFKLKYEERDWDDGLRGLVITNHGLIDIFRGIGDKQKSETIEVAPNIFTKYYGHTYYVNDVYDKFVYHSKQHNKEQSNKFMNMMFKMYQSHKDEIHDEVLIYKIEYTLERYLRIDKNLDCLTKLLYKEFKEYFDNGDIIITGSYLYNKMGYTNTEPNDLDISIINIGLLDEIKDFLENTKFLSKFINEQWNNKLGVFYTKKGMIDVFLNNHNNKQNETTIELQPNIFTKYYGTNWIVDVLNENIKKLENELENDPKNDIFIKTIEKFHDRIKELSEYKI